MSTHGVQVKSSQRGILLFRFVSYCASIQASHFGTDEHILLKDILVGIKTSLQLIPILQAPRRL